MSDNPFAAPGSTPPPYGSPTQYGGTPATYGSAPSYAPPPSGAWAGPPLAGWWVRVAASLIDTGIATIIYVVGIVLGIAIGGTPGLIVVVLGYLGGFAFNIWNVVRQGSTGQTVGKRALGIRLLREADGQVVGAGASVGRYFLHVVVDFGSLGIGYLWPIWDSRKQTFADKILSTVVIAK